MKNRKNKKYCLVLCGNCYTFASKYIFYEIFYKIMQHDI